MTLGVGQKQPIFASAYDRQGNIISSAKFVFWSSDTAIARVSRSGSVLGVAPGLAKVEARLQGKRASLAVLVTGGNSPAAAAWRWRSIPTTAVLLPGESVLITPHALREDGTPLPLARVVWKSLKPEVATVDSTGLVVAVAPGKSIVQANGGAGLMATVPVEVEQADFVRGGSQRGPRARGGGDAARPRPVPGQSRDHHRPPMALGRYAPWPPWGRTASCRRGSRAGPRS